MPKRLIVCPFGGPGAVALNLALNLAPNLAPNLESNPPPNWVLNSASDFAPTLALNLASNSAPISANYLCQLIGTVHSFLIHFPNQ